MRQYLVGLLIAALAVLPARADDRPAAKGEGNNPSFQDLKKEYDQTIQRFQDLRTAYQKAKTDEERKEIETKFIAMQKENPLPKLSGRFLSFAENHPKDADSFEALMLALQISQGNKETWGRALKALEKDWVKKPEMKRLVRVIGGAQDDASEELIRKVAEENPDHQVQGAAYKVLLQRAESVQEMAKQLKDDSQRERAEKQLGKENVKRLLARADKAGDESAKWSKLLKEKYADTVLDLSVGKKAPEVISQDLDGKKVKLSDLRGKVVVLDIWATWCPPCRAMIPHEREMVSRLKDKPFVLVSISADEEKKTLTEFLKETKMPWTHWWNGTGGIVEDWDVKYFPTIYVLDASGVIRHKDLRGEKLEEAVNKLLEETGKKETE